MIAFPAPRMSTIQERGASPGRDTQAAGAA